MQRFRQYECESSTVLQLASFPDDLKLRSEEVHVIHVRLDETFDGALTLLDDRERARAARFAFERDRRRFIAAHAWTRVAIGRCMRVSPISLPFAYGPFGKPRLAEAPVDLRFNLTHAGERALIALALGREVGIDVEEHQAVEVLDLARRFFAPSEIEALEALVPSERLPIFYRCWTRKEAFIKAHGGGLSSPLESFEVSLADEEPQVLRQPTNAPEQTRDWRLISLRMEPGYTAALAAEAGDWRIACWTVP